MQHSHSRHARFARSPLTRALVFLPESLPQAGRPYHVPPDDLESPPRDRPGMLAWDDCVCNFYFLMRILYTPHFTVIDLLVLFFFSLTSLLISLFSLPLLFLH